MIAKTDTEQRKYRFFKGISLLSIMLFFLISCSNKKSEKEIFDRNVKECMKPLVESGLDVVQARTVCDCAIKTMLEMDSSFLKMNPEKQKQLYEKHEGDIVERCDELKKLMK